MLTNGLVSPVWVDLQILLLFGWWQQFEMASQVLWFWHRVSCRSFHSYYAIVDFGVMPDSNLSIQHTINVYQRQLFHLVIFKCFKSRLLHHLFFKHLRCEGLDSESIDSSLLAFVLFSQRFLTDFHELLLNFDRAVTVSCLCSPGRHWRTSSDESFIFHCCRNHLISGHLTGIVCMLFNFCINEGWAHAHSHTVSIYNNSNPNLTPLTQSQVSVGEFTKQKRTIVFLLLKKLLANFLSTVVKHSKRISFCCDSFPSMGYICVF